MIDVQVYSDTPSRGAASRLATNSMVIMQLLDKNTNT
jgi:hypothetical protein